MTSLQLSVLHPKLDDLQKIHGSKDLNAIYGAGQINSPETMLIFMNPTARNVSSQPGWNGLRAPWLGTKTVWDIFESLSLISTPTYKKISDKKPNEWTPKFCLEVYQEIAVNGAYITNFAKCTLPDARPLSNAVYYNYRDLMLTEIDLIDPKLIITFGNQVSSRLLSKPVSVSDYKVDQYEVLEIKNQTYEIYPVYYPVGQGRRNLPLARKRLKYIINQ